MNLTLADWLILGAFLVAVVTLVLTFVLSILSWAWTFLRSALQRWHVDATRADVRSRARFRLVRRLKRVGVGIILVVIAAPFTAAFLIAGVASRPPDWSFNPAGHELLPPTGVYAAALGRFVHDPLVDLGIAFEDVAFPAVDGKTMRGWLVPGDPAATVAIVAVHGRAADRRNFLRALPIFHDRGYPVLLFDCRQSGGSDGDGKGDTSFGVRQSQDVQSAVRLLKEGRGFSRVVAVGSSQGAAAAIMAAAQSPRIDGVVAISSYRHVRDLVDSAATSYQFPRWLGSLVSAVALWRYDFDEAEGAWTVGDEPAVFNPITAVSRISPRPLLLIHGTADTGVSTRASEELFDRAGEPKTLWLAPNAGHDVDAIAGMYSTELADRLGTFLREYFPIESAPAPTETPN
jgi:alpha-beta hydrolase superfamily lysophospholipase